MSVPAVASHLGAPLRITQSEIGIRAEYLQDAAADHLTFTFLPDFPVDQDTYVLLPACCYKGNQFDSLKINYPPLFPAEYASPDMPLTISDVPRLNKDGSGEIDVTTGDLSTPCVALYAAKEGRAWFFFTVQAFGDRNYGLRFGGGRLEVTYPHMRKRAYRWPFLVDSTDQPMDFRAGDAVELPYRVLSLPCASMEEFYRIYFEHRKCMGMDSSRWRPIPFETQRTIQIEKFNTMNWVEDMGFYAVITKLDQGQTAWQPWCGGGVSSYALMALGGPLEQERCIRTLEFLFKTQTPSGFFWDGADYNGSQTFLGKMYGYQENHADHWHLVRKSADVLLYAVRTLQLMEQRGLSIPPHLPAGARKCADAFVRLWDTYGQLGQFVDLRTGELAVGNSTAGAMAGVALTACHGYFHESRYLEVAEASTLLLYERDALQGFTAGGPEEVLQCPDSESAYALMESAVVLYEATGRKEWLDRAVYLVHHFSSWVVSYNYHFPPESEFGRLGMKTTGSVWANVQNKHSTPAPAVFSGNAIYKVWKWTGDPAILELFLDVSMTMSQYMSTNERPIWSWDVPKDATLLQDDSIRAPREQLPQGFICERVNLSDWESERCIGGVFNGSTWAEVSNLLVQVECIDHPEVRSWLGC